MKPASPRRAGAQRFSGTRGVHAEAEAIVNRPVEEVYTFWRKLENLSRFMDNVLSVTEEGPTRSHWMVSGPAGTTLEWDAEIVNEEPNKVIGWKTVPGSTVAHAGSVNFRDTGGGLATLVRVKLQYDPPAGRIGGLVASWLGSDPETQIAGDLERMKHVLESGPAPP
jgi:uncharacterized membrane protein